MIKLLHNRRLLTCILAMSGMGIIIFYTLCSDSCRYLKGDIFGLDLKYLGLIYMGLLLVLVALKKADLSLALISLGIGGEFFLVGYQARAGVYCPYCLAFGCVILLMFSINYDKKKVLIMALSALLGFLFFLSTFSGSLTPLYAWGRPTSLPGFGPIKLQFSNWNGSIGLIYYA